MWSFGVSLEGRILAQVCAVARKHGAEFDAVRPRTAHADAAHPMGGPVAWFTGPDIGEDEGERRLRAVRAEMAAMRA